MIFPVSFAPPAVMFAQEGWSLAKEHYVSKFHDNSVEVVPALPRDFHSFIAGRALRSALRVGGLGAITAIAQVSGAFAQAAGAANGIGAQVQSMTAEGSTAGGFVGSTAMYCAALVCLVGGAWALWKSRQPQNREGGHVAMGVAGLVLCGLFAGGGAWINKAANTTSGGNAQISSTAGVVTFTGG